LDRCGRRMMLLTRLRFSVPVIQAPMLGVSTVEMALAVTGAGGLGTFAATSIAPADLPTAVCELRNGLRQQGSPDAFALNFFVLPDPYSVDSPEMESYRDVTARFSNTFRSEVGLPPRPSLPTFINHSLAAQVEALLAMAKPPPSVSFTFGCPDRAMLRALGERGIYTMGTATTAEEAAALASAGVHAVVAQGFEAGGHRGSWMRPFDQSLVGTMALVPAVVDECGTSIPVIAAGGIADGRGVAAALALGAQAAQVGTAYVACRESSAPPRHMDRVAETTSLAGHTTTTVTDAFSGRPARGFAGRMTHATRPLGDDLPPYPIHLRLMADLRARGLEVPAATDDVVHMWAGQAVGLARGGESAAEVTRRLFSEQAQSVFALMCRRL